ncbi:uncharacterized protein LOC144165360 [Haemaphysalis longicornis]
MAGNFRPVERWNPRKRRNEAAEAFDDWGLTALASSTRKRTEVSLQVFFSAKTHKEGCPFRAIVSEKGTWQRDLGRFLQVSLSKLAIDDPFLVRSSDVVSTFLEAQSSEYLSAFSVDIKDLYYSMPRDLLLDAVTDAIDNFGNVKFQTECGISVDKYLDAFVFYLDSTFVNYNDQLHLQKNGVCIGSSLAPVLSDLLLAAFDRTLQASLRDLDLVQVFRYVDDFLVLFEAAPDTTAERVDDLFCVFVSAIRPLELTKEVPEEGSMRFLDLILACQFRHIW